MEIDQNQGQARTLNITNLKNFKSISKNNLSKNLQILKFVKIV